MRGVPSEPPDERTLMTSIRAEFLQAGDRVTANVTVVSVEPTSAVCSPRKGARPVPAVLVTYSTGRTVTLDAATLCVVEEFRS